MTHDVKPSLRTFFCICFLLCSVFIHFLLSRPHLFFWFWFHAWGWRGNEIHHNEIMSGGHQCSVKWVLEIENFPHLDRYCGAFWTGSGKKLGSITCWVPTSTDLLEMMIFHFPSSATVLRYHLDNVYKRPLGDTHAAYYWKLWSWRSSYALCL